MRRLPLLIVLFVAAGLTPAHAAPSNDDRSSASVIEDLPFVGVADMRAATIELDEEVACLAGAMGAGDPVTVWYQYGPPVTGTVAVRAYRNDEIGSLPVESPSIGIYRMTGDGVELIGCSEGGSAEDDVVDLVSTLVSGETYHIQLGCRCIRSLGTRDSIQLMVGPAPVNDDRADATPIASLPYEDGPWMLGADLEPDEPPCDPPPGQGQIDLTLLGPDGSVWYRYTAADDGVLLAQTFRMFAAPRIDVFEATDDGVDEVSCTPSQFDDSDNSYDNTRVGIQVAAGRTYLIRIYEDTPDEYETSFSLQLMPRQDWTVSDLQVSSAEDPVGTRRTVSFDWALDPDAEPILDIGLWTPRHWARVEVMACPHGQPSEACFVVDSWTGDTAFWEFGPFHASISWQTAGCIGDYSLQVTVIPPFALDPQPADNEAVAQVQLAGGGLGVGAGQCAFNNLPV